jgi:hypothetical protein
MEVFDTITFIGAALVGGGVIILLTGIALAITLMTDDD